MDIGIDVGGTFTDLVALDRESHRLEVLKVPSTPHDPSVAILRALEAMSRPAKAGDGIVHGTTIATNAVLERKGAVCGLITTRGFRDVLELRRRDRPRLYGLTDSFEPLIPRELRLEASERLDPSGAIVQSLDEEDVRLAARALRGMEAVVISFLHAYANPIHERRAREIVQEEAPAAFVVLGSDVLPEYREFERTSTAVVNAYVQPVVSRYLQSLRTRLHQHGYDDVLVVQSNGGVMSSQLAQELPVNTVLSGPAAGVIAGAAIGQAAGHANCITADVGGTSFDVSLVAAGHAQFAEEKLIEYGVPIRIPHIDIVTIGAGGGSIAWLDRGGLLQVGPHSAGADPGPAAWGRGGTRPTVTDAQLVLGRINPARPIGGSSTARLNIELAREAIDRHIATPLKLSVENASLAILEVVNSAMAGCIRSVSVERGHDPRDFTLIAFGGAGPLHACALVREVGLGHALIPPHPGVTSALGCVLADFRHDFVRTINQPLEQLDLGRAYELLAEQRHRGSQLLIAEGIGPADCATIFQADMAYEGQIHTLRVTLPEARPASYSDLQDAFDREYRQEYGHTLSGFPVMAMNLCTTVIGRREEVDLSQAASSTASATSGAPSGRREAYFRDGTIVTPVMRREGLSAGTTLPGPCIVEQVDSTAVIEPDMRGIVDELGNILIRRNQA